jgi:hypothetical protein
MNLDSSFTQRPTVTSIDIDFRGGKAFLKIGFNGNPEEKFPIKYLDEKFALTIERQLKDRDIGVLDITQIHSYYQAKLIDYLLVKVLKKGLVLISKLDLNEIVPGYLDKKPEVLDDKDFFISSKITLVCKWATELINNLDLKFKDINERLETSLVNTSDRSVLIKKCKEELYDNVYKKHALVVNEIINYACGYEIPKSIFPDFEEGIIKDLIAELQG